MLSSSISDVLVFSQLAMVMWDRKKRHNSLGIIANSIKGLEYPLYVAKIYYFMLHLNASLLIFESVINHIATVNNSEKEIFSETVILIWYSMSTRIFPGFNISCPFLCLRSKPLKLKFLSFH